jgi:toxin-antitoxin system PIN domain toxin
VPACLIDTNLWLAVSFEAHPFHGQARGLLLAATDTDPWLWCRATQQSFLRLASTPALLAAYKTPRATNRDALTALQTLLGLRQVGFAEEPEGLMAVWTRIGGMAQAAPKLWMDAYLAAFAIAAEIPFLTLDRDFSAFEAEGLELKLPL